MTLDNDFYGELQRSQQKNWRGLSCEVVAGVLLVIFIIGAIVVWQLAAGVQRAVQIRNFTFAGLLKSESPVSSDTAMELIVTDSEITALLSGAAANPQFPFTNPQSSTTSDGIKVLGLTRQQPTTSAALLFVPTVSDGKLVLRLKKVTVGKITVPSAAVKILFGAATEFSGAALVPGNFAVSAVTAEAGQLKIVGSYQ